MNQSVLAGDRSVFGWRLVASVLASEKDRELLEAIGIPPPTGATRSWARSLLDRVEDFWEVYDVEPDGGSAARSLEAELAEMAGPAMGPLHAVAAIFSRRLDDKESVAHWRILLDDIWTAQATTVEAPDGLFDRVRATLEQVDWPPTAVGPLRMPQEIDDPWERAFVREHSELDAYVLADEALEQVQTAAALEHLAEELSPTDRDALERWANLEDEAHQDGPRPSTWPTKPLLKLSTSSRFDADS